MRLDRAATKLLALASTMGVIGAITVTSAAPAGAATSGGPRQQAIVALAGDWSISVPGLQVQALLAGVQAEIVDGTSAQLAQLAATPGVLGVEPNLTAHLESNTFGGRDDSTGNNGGNNGGGPDAAHTGVPGGPRRLPDCCRSRAARSRRSGPPRRRPSTPPRPLTCSPPPRAAASSPRARSAARPASPTPVVASRSP